LAIFLGRAFCGWLCPSGFVNQMLGKVAITKLKIRNKKMRWAQLGMVVTILIGLGVYFIYDNPRVMIPIRTSDEYFNSLIMSIRFADWYWAVRTVIVVALIAASLIISNFWCRFICPVGGAMELIRFHIPHFQDRCL
jgi:riboflavin biosynthesis protein ribAB